MEILQKIGGRRARYHDIEQVFDVWVVEVVDRLGTSCTRP